MRTKGQTGRKGMMRLTEQFYGLTWLKHQEKISRGKQRICNEKDRKKGR